MTERVTLTTAHVIKANAAILGTQTAAIVIGSGSKKSANYTMSPLGKYLPPKVKLDATPIPK